MVSTIRKNVENNLGCLLYLFILGFGVKNCVYNPILSYGAVTESMREVLSYNARHITDRNSNGILSKEERRLRDEIYGKCKSHAFEIGFAYNLPTKSLAEETNRIFLCIEEEYRKSETFLF